MLRFLHFRSIILNRVWKLLAKFDKGIIISDCNVSNCFKGTDFIVILEFDDNQFSITMFTA